MLWHWFLGAKDEEYKQIKLTESKSKHDHEKGKKFHSGKVNHKIENEEGGGTKHTHHDKGSHKSSEHHEGGSQDGLKHQEGSKRKKLNYKKVWFFLSNVCYNYNQFQSFTFFVGRIKMI